MKDATDGLILLRSLEKQEGQMMKHHNVHEIQILQAQIDVLRWVLDMELVQ